MRAGEIVGIAGVAGNGQSELLEAISGMRDQSAAASCSTASRSRSTAIDGAGRARDARPRACARGPPAHVASSLAFEEWENAILGYQTTEQYRQGRRSSISRRSSPTPSGKIEKFDIRPANERLKTANFSGGNQQKIVLAREMERDPDVLIVGQPTRGVDIGAIEFIHNQIIKMRDAGQGHPAGLGRARRNPLALRPHPRDVRRPHRRRARARTPTEGELGLMMAGIEQQGGAPNEHALRQAARAGPTIVLLPLINLLLAFVVAGLVVLLIGENPLAAASCHHRRRLRLRLRLRLHALLRDQLHLHRPRRGGRRPCRPVQHRRRGPGLYRRPRRHRSSASPSTSACPGALTFPLAILAAARVRRALGLHPGLAAGQARQPRRHHHHHVQLHRRGADGLHAGQRAEAGRLDGAGDRHDSPRARSAEARLAARSVRLQDRYAPSTSPSCWRCSLACRASAC